MSPEAFVCRGARVRGLLTGIAGLADDSVIRGKADIDHLHLEVSF
jgi:hypothetical protein